MCCSWVIPGGITGCSWAATTDTNGRLATANAATRRVDDVIERILNAGRGEVIGFEEIRHIMGDDEALPFHSVRSGTRN
jgi:hypothetical protein